MAAPLVRNPAARGVGSTFTVDLPVAVERRGEFATRQRKGLKEDTPIELTAAPMTKTPELEQRTGVTRETERRTPLPLLGVRVLLVEDDDDSRDLLSLVLERHGAEVVPDSIGERRARFVYAKNS